MNMHPTNYEHAQRFDAETVERMLPYQLHSFDDAVARFDAMFFERDRMLGRADSRRPEQRMDAAADFVSSTLEILLGGEDIVRGMSDEFLFVPTRGTAILPVRPLLPNGVRVGKYNVRGHRGAAQWTNPKDTRSLPFVDIAREQKRVKGEYFGIAMQTSIVDDWENARLGINDAAEKQQVVNYELDYFQEYVSCWGGEDLGIPGMFVLGDALIYEAGLQFSAGVSAQNMMNVLAAIDKAYKRANNNAGATALIAPDVDLIAMQNTYFGTGGEGPSVWDRAAPRYAWLRNARWTDRLTRANAAGDGHRWVLTRPEPNELFNGFSANMVFGPFQDRMTFDTVVLRRAEGTISKRPERTAYVDWTPAP